MLDYLAPGTVFELNVTMNVHTYCQHARTTGTGPYLSPSVHRTRKRAWVRGYTYTQPDYLTKAVQVSNIETPELLTLFLLRMEKMIIYDQFLKKSYKIVDKVSSHEKITVCWRVILLPINRKKKLTSH